jgi:hypothetical protein
VLLDAADANEDLSVAQVWADIERVVPRSEVAAALAAILELAPAPALAEEQEDVWRVELVKRYHTVRPFLPLLSDVVAFGAVDAGQPILDAVHRLPELVGRKRVWQDDVARSDAGGGLPCIFVPILLNPRCALARIY